MRKIYSKNQIVFATVIGGPLIAGYLISENFKTFSDVKSSKKTLKITLVSTPLFFALLLIIPESIMDKIPSISVALIPVLTAEILVRQHQSKKIADYFSQGFSKASIWGVMGKSILSLMLSVITLFVLYLPITLIASQNSNLSNLTEYCASTYSESKIKNDLVFITEDAVCYIFDKQTDNKYSHEQINEVLDLEFEYLEKNGLINQPPSSHTQDLPLIDPSEYIYQEQKSGLNLADIQEILLLEEGYLKLIGAVGGN